MRKVPAQLNDSITEPQPPLSRPFASAYGHFAHDGLEYIITRPDTPRPWVNVITNGNYGCIVSQNGGGFSWQGNSQLRMLNRWDQDLIQDRMGRFLYLRNADDGALWSADRQPVCPEFDAWQVRHGLGYTITETVFHGVRCEKTVFVPFGFPCEFWLIHLSNLSDHQRTVDLISCLEWQLGAVHDWHREFHKTFVETAYSENDGILTAWKRPELGSKEPPFAGFHFAIGTPTLGFDGDKRTFLGSLGSISAPQSVIEGQLRGSAGRWTDPIASLHTQVTMGPGETKRLAFVLGAGGLETALRIRSSFPSTQEIADALEEVHTYWRARVDVTHVETPDSALNLMTNVWLKYQAIAGRLWARTGYYQNSGAFGFRDQLQDSHIWLSLEPERTREQILLHAAQQFTDGTVRHWWHPGTPIAATGDCTDDLLWLPYLALNYIDETDDSGIWDATAPWAPEGSGQASLYEHSIAAIEKALSRLSPRGLPLIGECDWNDGFSHLGRAWKGESVWLAHFMVGLLNRFAETARERGDTARANRYSESASTMAQAVNEHAWDGEWYWRATKDNGEKIGSHACAENRIDLIAQAWSVISGVAPPDRARRAMESARQHLFREYGPLLLTPAYTRMDHEIGYITRYAPGVRENGGVYSHAATWGILALCMLGEGDAAWKAYASMCPPRRGENPDLYYAEPYVLPGNIDGPDSPTFGRGGWTWYTGSAVWMHKVALDWICGVRATRGGLLIDPCVPGSWKSFHVTRHFRGEEYRIEVSNPNGVQHGVQQVQLNGKAVDGAIIPPTPNGPHEVRVLMG